MGIIAGKIITGTQLVYEKPQAAQPARPAQNASITVKSLSELRTSERVEVKEKENGETEIVPVDKRLSSYFVVNKESDYLDHNKTINRR